MSYCKGLFIFTVAGCCKLHIIALVSLMKNDLKHRGILDLNSRVTMPAALTDTQTIMAWREL